MGNVLEESADGFRDKLETDFSKMSTLALVGIAILIAAELKHRAEELKEGKHSD